MRTARANIAVKTTDCKNLHIKIKILTTEIYNSMVRIFSVVNYQTVRNFIFQQGVGLILYSFLI